MPAVRPASAAALCPSPNADSSEHLLNALLLPPPADARHITSTLPVFGNTDSIEYLKNVLLRLYETGEADSLLPVVAQVRQSLLTVKKCHLDGQHAAAVFPLQCCWAAMNTASMLRLLQYGGPCTCGLQVLQFSPAEVARCRDALHSRSGHLTAGAGTSECTATCAAWSSSGSLCIDLPVNDACLLTVHAALPCC